MGGNNSQQEVTSARDLLAYYADRGYRVTDIDIDHSVPGTTPKRNEVSIELTLSEPVEGVLDRLERDDSSGTS